MQNEKRGKFLLECRKKKKISQDELGEMISYSRNNISKWERGISFPSDPNVLEKLATIFDISIEEIMYGEYRSKNNEKEIIENLTNEYKSKYKKLTRKNIIIFSLIIITILIITVFTYLIFIKGTIKVYKVSIDDENFILDDSLLFISNSISVLNLNKVISKNNEEIKYIELYYYENNKKITNDFKTSESISEEFKNKLLQNGFKADSNEIYEKYFDDNTYIQVAKDLSVYFILCSPDSEICETLIGHLYDKDMIYSKDINCIEVEDKHIEFTNTIKNCDEDTCSTIEDYISYINYLKKLNDN